jgi:hypothetical protein
MRVNGKEGVPAATVRAHHGAARADRKGPLN